jgi:putative hydrolase of the HAD superfamily
MGVILPSILPGGSPVNIPFDVIAFDADDTLWHNERLYIQAQEAFAGLLAHYHPAEWVNARLYETETRNIQHYGYGIKAFALSMIETAVELTEGRISGQDIQAVIGLARGMLGAPVELLHGAAETIPVLAGQRRLMLITKGDLLDQERKVSLSGLAGYFEQIEVVSQKTPESYAKVLRRYAIPAERFLMVGNSLRSDIWPVLALGGSAVYIPYETTWTHEAADPPPADQPGYYHLEHLGQLPGLLERLAGGK